MVFLEFKLTGFLRVLQNWAIISFRWHVTKHLLDSSCLACIANKFRKKNPHQARQPLPLLLPGRPREEGVPHHGIDQAQVALLGTGEFPQSKKIILPQTTGNYPPPTSPPSGLRPSPPPPWRERRRGLRRRWPRPRGWTGRPPPGRGGPGPPGRTGRSRRRLDVSGLENLTNFLPVFFFFFGKENSCFLRSRALLDF